MRPPRGGRDLAELTGGFFAVPWALESAGRPLIFGAPCDVE